MFRQCHNVKINSLYFSFLFLLSHALTAYGSSRAKAGERKFVTAAAKQDPLTHCTGSESNPHLRSHLSCCNQIHNHCAQWEFLSVLKSLHFQVKDNLFLLLLLLLLPTVITGKYLLSHYYVLTTVLYNFTCIISSNPLNYMRKFLLRII